MSVIRTDGIYYCYEITRDEESRSEGYHLFRFFQDETAVCTWVGSNEDFLLYHTPSPEMMKNVSRWFRRPEAGAFLNHLAIQPWFIVPEPERPEQFRIYNERGIPLYDGMIIEGELYLCFLQNRSFSIIKPRKRTQDAMLRKGKHYFFYAL